jgi:hypothetical protein
VRVAPAHRLRERDCGDTIWAWTKSNGLDFGSSAKTLKLEEGQCGLLTAKMCTISTEIAALWLEILPH